MARPQPSRPMTLQEWADEREGRSSPPGAKPVRRDTRKRDIDVLEANLRVEPDESAVEALAYLDTTPAGFTKVRGDQGVEFVALESLSPLLQLAVTGKRRMTLNQIDAGMRLMTDNALANASAGNTAAVIAFLEKAPIVSAADRAARRLADRDGSLGGMRRARECKTFVDLVPFKIDSARRLMTLRSRMSRVGWFVVESLCIHELTIERLSVGLDESLDYVRVRCREALSELAAAYAALDAEERHRSLRRDVASVACD